MLISYIEKGNFMSYKNCSKFLSSRILSIVMVLSMIITPVTVEAKAVPAKSKSNVELSILATSDLHGRFASYEYASNEATNKGSLTQLATAIKELRKENPNTILVDNGDAIQDNSSELFLDSDIHPMIAAMNFIGYDAWTLGNHEFNYLPKLDHVLKQSKAQVLCGNVYTPDGKQLGKDYTIIKKDGVRVAIIGMVTPNIVKWDSENLKGWKVTDPVEETKQIVKDLKGKADVFIAVEHMGVEGEYGNSGSGVTELANQVPELTAIIAGHTHSQISEQLVNGVLITEPGSYGQAISKIDLTLKKTAKGYVVNTKKGQVVLMNDKNTGKVYEEDAELLETLAPYHKMAVEDANKTIGKLVNGDLVAPNYISKIPTIQIEPTALITLINSVQKEYGHADISSAAAFRTDINVKEGILNKSDAAKIYKFDNTLYVVEITGAQLKNYMEWSAQYYNTFKPGDLTVSFHENIRDYNYDMFSGVNYSIDISKPVIPTDKVKEGNPHLHFAPSRITNLTKEDGTPVKDTDVFKLAVNNYRYSTTLSTMFGDGIKVIYRSEEELGDNGRIRELIIDYITNKKVITNYIDDNWKIVGVNWSNKDRELLKTYIDLGKIQIPVSEDGRTPNVRSITVEDLNKVHNAQENTIRIITFNDLHGNVESTAKEAGVANIAGIIDAYRTINPNLIPVSAGDSYQGTAISNVLYGSPINEFMKLAGVEYSALGNHEFDWGMDKIENWAKQGGFTFLAANIYDTATNKPVSWAREYDIKEVNGVKIGFIGFATPETAYKTKPSNVLGLEFKEPAKIAPELIKKVKEEGADVVVALTHLGASQDASGKISGEAAELAKQVEGFDVIISAHTHMQVKGSVNKTPIIQSGKNGRDLGIISLSMKGTSLLSVDLEILPIGTMNATTKGNQEVANMVGKYKKEVGSQLDVVIATAKKEYPHDRYEKVSELGEWVAEIMRVAGDAQIGITNGGGIRIPIEKGEITVGTMYSLMPFDNTVVTMKMKGEDIKNLFEHGIDNKEVGWVQYSGVTVFYNPDQPKGKKVKEMRLMDGTLVKGNEYYTVATNDFMAENGDNYDFSNGKDVVNTNIPIRDVLIDELKEKGELDFNSKNILVQGSDAVNVKKSDITEEKDAA